MSAFKKAHICFLKFTNVDFVPKKIREVRNPEKTPGYVKKKDTASKKAKIKK